MAAKNKMGQEFQVKNGKAVLVTPAVSAVEEKVVEINPLRIARELKRVARKKETAEQTLARAQSQYDELVSYEAELLAIQKQVADE